MAAQRDEVRDPGPDNPQSDDLNGYDRDVAGAEARLLATVLELALVVAQTGAKVVPPFEAPPPLRPFLQFTAKVPAPALRAARRALDDDPVFRARVATVATDDLVGRAGSLFVRRPEGWDDEFRQLVVDALGVTSHEGAAKRATRLEKKVAGLEAALARTVGELARSKVEVLTVQSQLAEERRLRSALAAELAALRSAAGQSADVEQRALLDATSATTAARALAAERDAALQRADVAERDLRQRASFDASVGRALSALDDLRGELREFRAVGTTGSPGTAPSPGGAPRGELGGQAPAGGRPPAPARRVAPARPPGLRRQPVALPPGVFDDTVQAAWALVRTPDVVILVDAYNVAKWRWPQAGLADLRARLMAMAVQISQRAGASIHLVFDGAHDGSRTRPGGSADVRVVFTPEGVEADDAILEMTAKAPLAVPVVVVSNDMRVVEGAIALGANVLPNEAFAALSGSSPN